MKCVGLGGGSACKGNYSRTVMTGNVHLPRDTVTVQILHLSNKQTNNKEGKYEKCVHTNIPICMHICTYVSK